MTPELEAGLLAGGRWLVFAAVMVLVGTAGARLVLARLGTEPFLTLKPALDQRLARSVVWIAGLWLIALLSFLASNVVVWFGPSGLGQFDRVRTMIFETRWGQTWLMTFGLAAGASVILIVARFVPSIRVAALAAATLAAIIPTPLVGHAAGHGLLVWTLYAAHLLGAGLWLGTVLVLAGHTWPLWRAASPSWLALRQMLLAITPVALAGAALAVVSGGWVSVLHVWPPQTALETSYGTTLASKTLTVVVVAAFGWLNWRRFGPRAEPTDGRRRLRWSVICELVLAFGVVLGLTAWLTGLEMPM